MKILLACSAGMSTSMLVKKIEDYIKKEGLSHEVKAVSVSEAKAMIADKKYDVVLVGPQVRFELDGLRRIAAPVGIPVQDIPTPLYAGMKGAEVLKLAEKLYSESL